MGDRVQQSIYSGILSTTRERAIALARQEAIREYRIGYEGYFSFWVGEDIRARTWSRARTQAEVEARAEAEARAIATAEVENEAKARALESVIRNCVKQAFNDFVDAKRTRSKPSNS